MSPIPLSKSSPDVPCWSSAIMLPPLLADEIVDVLALVRRADNLDVPLGIEAGFGVALDQLVGRFMTGPPTRFRIGLVMVDQDGDALNPEQHGERGEIVRRDGGPYGHEPLKRSGETGLNALPDHRPKVTSSSGQSRITPLLERWPLSSRRGLSIGALPLPSLASHVRCRLIGSPSRASVTSPTRAGPR
jgi:hypothetical protein